MKGINALFINRDGKIRLWAYLILAAAMYLISSAGVYRLYRYAFGEMLAVWGVTAENVSRAPAAVQILYNWSGVIVTLIQNACLLASAFLLNRLTRRKRDDRRSGALAGATAGAAVVMLIWALLMLTGSVRLGWRWSKPAFSWHTPALVLTTLSAAAGTGSFFYHSIYGEMRARIAEWAALMIAALAAMSLEAFAGGIQPICLVNAALTALICCLMDGRRGAAAGFLFARRCIAQAVLGFAGYEAALYETYPVNLYWLSGGNYGPDNGLMTTIVLLALIVLMIRKQGLSRMINSVFHRKATDKSPA